MDNFFFIYEDPLGKETCGGTWTMDVYSGIWDLARLNGIDNILILMY